MARGPNRKYDAARYDFQLAMERHIANLQELTKIYHLTTSEGELPSITHLIESSAKSFAYSYDRGKAKEYSLYEDNFSILFQLCKDLGRDSAKHPRVDYGILRTLESVLMKEWAPMLEVYELEADDNDTLSVPDVRSLIEWRTGLPNEFKELIGIMDTLIALVLKGLEKKADIADKVFEGTEEDAGNIELVISGVLFDEGSRNNSDSDSGSPGKL